MKKKYFLLVLLAATLALGAYALSPASGAFAQDPGGTPSGDGIDPLYLAGNPSCATLNADNTNFPNITSNYGFKIQVNYNRTVPMNGTAVDTALTGGAPADSINSITVSSADNLYFNWLATLGIDAVIVKGGSNADAYVYIPEDTADTRLHAPVNPQNGQVYGLSHIEFCYDYELTATKTAVTSFNRTYTWAIDKSVVPASHTGFAGDTFSSDYDVIVDQTVTDSGFTVSGEIVVNNPTPYTVGFSIGDSVGGAAATVACPTYSLLPGASTTCTYSASLASATNGTNTATITSTTTGVGGATASASYTFGDPVIAGFPEVGVTDSVQGLLGTASGDITFEYSDDFACPTDPAAYTNGVYTSETPNRASIKETLQYDDAQVTVTCYAPVVSKVATAEWKQKYDWTISKAATPASHVGFAGEGFTSNYDVVLDQTLTESFKAYGTIYVTNPAGAPDSMTVDVADAVNGTAATLACGGTLTVAPGATGECAYTVSLPDSADRTNTATVTFHGIDFTATAPVDFGDPEITGKPAVNVTDSVQGALGSASDDITFQYSDNFVCPADESLYVDGVYEFEVPNTASIAETGQSDHANVTVTCYAPVVTKDAAGLYDLRHTWDVSKSVTNRCSGPANVASLSPGFVSFAPIVSKVSTGLYEGGAGGSTWMAAPLSGLPGYELCWTWTVHVSETSAKENFGVSGTIYVVNPAGEPMTVEVTDVLDDGTVADVDCGDGTPNLTVPAGQIGTCTYSAKPTEMVAAENTATATINGAAFTGSAEVDWNLGQEFNATATVTDDQIGLNELLTAGAGLWEFSGTGTHTCSIEQADYGEDGMYSQTVENTAVVTSGDHSASDDAETSYTCYAPVVDKDAFATYDETHTWAVTKSVDPESQSGYPGDTLNWLWTIDVSETFQDSNFAIHGTITIANPSPNQAMEVFVYDVLDDGTPVVLSCEGEIRIPAGETYTCTYTASPDDASATLNTATVTFREASFIATADVNFVANVIGGTATVTDHQLGLNKELVVGEGPWQFTGPGLHTCSTSAADYGEGGMYSDTEYNTATLTDSEGNVASDDASTTYTCQAGFMDLLKLTGGLVDPTRTWSFTLSAGPDGFGSTKIGQSTTKDDPDGLLLFGSPTLRPDKTYTVCETDVPAGWTSFWQVSLDGGLTWATVVPYNPNADDSPPADVGNRCVDFGAGTNLPVTAGETVHFQVDNTYPGGAPRTPGYWKNWNRCTNGGQQFTADANGGWQEGYWLLEDVLDPAIGGGITWDDILPDSFVFSIDRCAVGVDILDKRLVGDPAKVADGKKVASDPLHNLATHLLAAELNFGAGACTTQAALDAALAAETMLDKYNFNGNGYDPVPKKSPDLAEANRLAGILDSYNNGMYCGN